MKIKKIQNLANKGGVYNQQFDFFIDEQNGKLIENSSIKSYTFPVYRLDGNDDNIENVVFTLNNESGYDVSLVKYDITKEDLESPTFDGVVLPTQMVTILGKTTDFFCKILMCFNDGHGSSGSSHIAGDNCTNSSFLFYVVIYYGGSSNNTTGNTTNNGNTNTTGNQGNTNNTSTSGGGGTITTPVGGSLSTKQLNFIRSLNSPEDFMGFYYSASYQVLNYISNCSVYQTMVVRNFFNSGNNLFIQEQPEKAQANMLNYLIQNNFSAASVNFINSCNIRIANNPSIPSITPLIIEKIIESSNLDPCAKTVLEDLKNTSVCDIAQVLAKLNAETTVYNTVIKTETLPNGNTSPATTQRDSAYNYTIYISPNYTGKTKLFRATIILHELIHAYFMSLYDDYHNGNPPNLNAYNDFAYLFDLYVNKKYPSTMAPSIHHQQMATDYADAIARALQEYQTGIAVSSSSQPNQVYSDLAFGSLMDSPSVFDMLFPVGNPNRQRIINRYAAEQSGHPIGQGTPDNQTQIGQPCN